MIKEYQKIVEQSISKWKENKKLIAKLKKEKYLDAVFKDAHNEVFEEVDCLKCANCCKTISPIFKETDIDRISKYKGVSPQKFIETYLKIDNDGDYVLQTSPCSFLNEDNYCSIYEVRPKACAGYPHTNMKRIDRHLDLVMKNTKVCPGVGKILEKINLETYKK